MKNFNLPKIGLRNIKTALAVFLCMVLFPLVSKDSNPFYACIAAVICMKDTVPNTFKIGVDRIFGTILGGFFGVLCIYTIEKFPIINDYKSLLTPIVVIILIYICTLINKPGSVTISCIVLIGIIVNHSGPDSYSYAIGRSIDTTIGIIIAFLVNKYINLPNDKKVE